MRALEVDFDPMPLAGAVERRKSRGDRADGRKENGWRPSGFRKPAGFSTTSTLNFLPFALYFWPLAKNRDNCRSFEPWTPARDAFATAFFGQREPHLNELWAMSEEMA